MQEDLLAFQRQFALGTGIVPPVHNITQSAVTVDNVSQLTPETIYNTVPVDQDMTAGAATGSSVEELAMSDEMNAVIDEVVDKNHETSRANALSAVKHAEMADRRRRPKQRKVSGQRRQQMM
jgi:hypothetical protein